jgi:integrase
MGRLTARKVETDTPGVYVDGQGLRLVVGATGTRKWVFRFMRRGRSQEMGLGGSDVSLAMARERAADARRTLAAGRNPIDAARLAQVGQPTFGQVADEFVAAKQSEWRNGKHRAQWNMTLQRYCGPLRALPVDEIDTAAVLEILKPLWTRVPETASRLRGRIETVLDAARARGLIGPNEANPARWRGHLDKLLPKRQKLTRGHHAAMPFAEVSQFMASLRKRDAVAALTLEFSILTAARSGEVLGARWAEIDFQNAIWTVPAARMKGGRTHRVPLSRRALVILKKLHAARTGEFIFPGQRPDKPLSAMAMEMILRRMKADGATVHGFRSSFRDWCGEVSTFPREVAEAALAHVAGDDTERAYRRGDALEKRRELMEAWGAYCEPKAGNVVSIARRPRG